MKRPGNSRESGVDTPLMCLSMIAHGESGVDTPLMCLSMIAMIAHADVLNVYGGPAGLQPEFNVLTGEIVDEEEETLPLLGLIVEYAW